MACGLQDQGYGVRDMPHYLPEMHQMADRIANPWGQRTPYGPRGAVDQIAAARPERLRSALPSAVARRTTWPTRVDMFLENGVTEDDVDREAAEEEPKRMHSALFSGTPSGGLGLLPTCTTSI